MLLKSRNTKNRHRDLPHASRRSQIGPLKECGTHSALLTVLPPLIVHSNHSNKLYHCGLVVEVVFHRG